MLPFPSNRKWLTQLGDLFTTGFDIAAPWSDYLELPTILNFLKEFSVYFPVSLHWYPREVLCVPDLFVPLPGHLLAASTGGKALIWTSTAAPVFLVSIS